MTHHSPTRTVSAVTATMSHSHPPLAIGNLAAVRAALADRRRLVARTEAAWVAAAEAELSKHLPKGVRLDERGTWDGATYARYLIEAEKVEPDFKPRLRRLLAEIDILERLLSPNPAASHRDAA